MIYRQMVATRQLFIEFGQVLVKFYWVLIQFWLDMNKQVLYSVSRPNVFFKNILVYENKIYWANN